MSNGFIRNRMAIVATAALFSSVAISPVQAQWTANANGSISPTSGVAVGIGTATPDGSFQVRGLFHVNSDSVYIGTNADLTDTGGQNVLVGPRAGNSNTTGYFNVGIGLQALYSNTSGYFNSAIGRGSMTFNTTGTLNTALGTGSLYYNTDGANNTAVGVGALVNLTGTTASSFGNTALGFEAGYNTVGGGNVFLGNYAGYSETGSNKLYIANGPNAANVLVYGDFSAGAVGIGTVAPCTTSAPANCKLSVAGAIQAKEVVVNTGWSDYVFAPEYRLAPLNEVSAFIAANHHLPGVPSAAEVESNGVSLGGMQATLLAKERP